MLEAKDKLLDAKDALSEAFTKFEMRLKQNGGRTTATWHKQLRIFLWRSSVQLQRNFLNLLRDVCLACIVGILLGFLYEGVYEKARCKTVADQMKGPELVGKSEQWLDQCHDYHWFNRTWFSRAPFYCSPPGPLGDWETKQFDQLRFDYSQALTLSLLALGIISIQVTRLVPPPPASDNPITPPQPALITLPRRTPPRLQNGHYGP